MSVEAAEPDDAAEVVSIRRVPAPRETKAQRNARAFRALQDLFDYITDDDEDPSGADQCARLYEILSTFGMVVP